MYTAVYWYALLPSLLPYSDVRHWHRLFGMRGKYDSTSSLFVTSVVTSVVGLFHDSTILCFVNRNSDCRCRHIDMLRLLHPPLPNLSPRLYLYSVIIYFLSLQFVCCLVQYSTVQYSAVQLLVTPHQMKLPQMPADKSSRHCSRYDE